MTFIIDLFVFSDIFWLVMIGNIAHLMIELSLAIRRKDFTWKVFWRRNLIDFVAGILLSQAYAFAVSRGDNTPALTDFIGYGLIGSGISKKFVKHTDKKKANGTV